uniref:Uncharacterized protein n=1 Tax=Anguilla anguilla TaxID=7936 RepID=A0A0E9VGR6_ANGAN
MSKQCKLCAILL